MKILFLARLFYPHVGGVEKHVERLSEELIKLGHSVTVITERDDASEKDYEVYKGIKIYRIPVGHDEKKKKFEIWSWFWQHKELVSSSDIIHCHDVFFWYLPLRFYYPWKSVYTTFHGYEGYPIRKNAVSVRKLSERLSRGNICVGEFMKKWYGVKPTKIIYGAVDLPEKTGTAKKHTAIFIGRLDDQTGILTYTDATEKIRGEVKDFRLTIYGDGRLKNKIPKAFDVKGFQKNAEKEIGKYQYAFVSRYLAILEAMAEKRLVFAVYDNPVKEDYVKMTPFVDWIITASSAGELAEKVFYFLKHPDEEKKLIDKAYDWVKVQTWENLTKAYLSVWNA